MTPCVYTVLYFRVFCLNIGSHESFLHNIIGSISVKVNMMFCDDRLSFCCFILIIIATQHNYRDSSVGRASD